jgi:hypothetical protein
MATTVRKWHSGYRQSSSVFRSIGVSLAVLFHVVMIGICYFILKDPWAWLLFWYTPSFLFGLPWSFITSLLVANADLITVPCSLVFNAYLLGWLLDKLCS